MKTLENLENEIGLQFTEVLDTLKNFGFDVTKDYDGYVVQNSIYVESGYVDNQMRKIYVCKNSEAFECYEEADDEFLVKPFNGECFPALFFGPIKYWWDEENKEVCWHADTISAIITLDDEHLESNLNTAVAISISHLKSLAEHIPNDDFDWEESLQNHLEKNRRQSGSMMILTRIVS